MSKREVLEMLRELLRTAAYSFTDPDDYSGCNTKYYVDQEQLMANIETELEKEQARGSDQATEQPPSFSSLAEDTDSWDDDHS